MWGFWFRIKYMISFKDFEKIDLRVAKVLTAEKIEGSKKLIKLEIDLGKEKRIIIAGIGQFYQPEDLIGREIIVVANLEPKKIMGIESQGMLLAGHSEDGEIALLLPDKKIPPGSKVS